MASFSSSPPAFSLLVSTSIYPDLTGGIVWFCDSPTPEQRQEYATLCRELERDKKRTQRAHQCPYTNTAKCDGWQRDSEGNRRCDICSQCGGSREISLDTPIVDSDGNEIFLADTIPSIGNEVDTDG